MKSSLFLLAGVAGMLSLASCSENKTTETTATTTPDGTATTTTTTTRTYTDTDYHTRGDRMATRFASANKITDQATLAKLKTAYYNRAKRYDEMMTKFKADTAGMAQAKRDYMKANDQEFQTILVVPAQYQAYQSSYTSPDYDESSNLDIADQTAAASSATMPSDSASGPMSSDGMASGAGIDKSKTKLEDGSKLKVKDGEVKTKDAAGNKGGDVESSAPLKDSKTKFDDGSKLKVKGDGTVKVKDSDGSKTKL